jgi:hypothetical protein
MVAVRLVVAVSTHLHGEINANAKLVDANLIFMIVQWKIPYSGKVSREKIFTNFAI